MRSFICSYNQKSGFKTQASTQLLISQVMILGLIELYFIVEVLD